MSTRFTPFFLTISFSVLHYFKKQYLNSLTKLSNYLDQRLQSVKLTITILNEWKMLNAQSCSPPRRE